MSEPTRETYHHGNLRRALVEAALTLLEERGGEACTLREVARRSGVSHAAPYRHFRDRDALLAAVAAEGFAKLRRQIISRSRRARGGPAKLRVWGTTYVGFALRRPELFQLMFGRMLQKVARQEAADAADELRDDLIDLLGSCREEDLFSGLDPLHAARVGWATVHGVAQLALAGQLEIESKKDVEALAGEAVDVILAGLRSSASDDTQGS